MNELNIICFINESFTYVFTNINKNVKIQHENKIIPNNITLLFNELESTYKGSLIILSHTEITNTIVIQY